MVYRTRIFPVLLLTAYTASVGCDDGGGEGATPDGGGTDASRADGGADGSLGYDAGQPPDARPGDTGVSDTGGSDASTGDDNDSIAEARALTVGDSGGLDGVIDPAGDVDYFSFTATAGQWIWITTDANSGDDPAKIDTVITLLNADGDQLAQNDDAFPRVSTDSEIISLIPDDGTYYVTVEDFSTWNGDPAEGNPTFEYTLVVSGFTSDFPGVNVSTETGDDVAAAQALEFTGTEFGLVLGTLRDASDFDVFTVEVTGVDPRLLRVARMPVGTDGYGSDAVLNVLRTTDAAGTEVLAAVDPNDGPDQLGPRLAAGTYQIWVGDSAVVAGTGNPFYVLKVWLADENELEVEPNDTCGTSMLTMTGTDPIEGFLAADVDDGGDVDCFSFSATAGDTISVACGSARLGSGVEGLLVEVLNPAETVLDSMTEVLGGDLLIQDVAVAENGTHHVRLSKGAQSSTVSGKFVRCGVFL